jgi:hypothetical protein
MRPVLSVLSLSAFLLVLSLTQSASLRVADTPYSVGSHMVPDISADILRPKVVVSHSISFTSILHLRSHLLLLYGNNVVVIFTFTSLLY